MIYIPYWDEEYDNVYFTTSMNSGHKIEFSVFSKVKSINPTPISYTPCPINMDDLQGSNYIDFY